VDEGGNTGDRVHVILFLELVDFLFTVFSNHFQLQFG